MIVWNVGRRRGMHTASHPCGYADERLGCSSVWIVCCRYRTSMVCRLSGSSCAPWGSRHVQTTCRTCSMETAFRQCACAYASWGYCSWGTSFHKAHSGRLLLPCVPDCPGSLRCWTSLKSTKCNITSEKILSVLCFWVSLSWCFVCVFFVFFFVLCLSIFVFLLWTK